MPSLHDDIVRIRHTHFTVNARCHAGRAIDQQEHAITVGRMSTSQRETDGRSLFGAEVGGAIRRHRHERGYTQAKLAEAAALSPNYVARLERGELTPSLAVAVRVAAALGIGPSALVASFRKRTATTTRAA